MNFSQGSKHKMPRVMVDDSVVMEGEKAVIEGVKVALEDD